MRGLPLALLVALAAVGAALPPVCAGAPASHSVLVEVDADGGAEVARALGSRASRPLVAGWRAYELRQPIDLREARRRLAGIEAAGSVQPDTALHVLGEPNDPELARQWPLQRVDALAGWELAAGGRAPVTVAVIDTGVDVDHPDLVDRLWRNPGEVPANGLDDDGNGLVDDSHGWDFASGDGSVFDAGDGEEHGTHVAGSIAARRDNGIGIAGLTDNARLMPLKILRPGGGRTSDAIAAIRYATDHGARIINASWGSATFPPALCDAIAQAGADGVLVVAAAGNGGTDNDLSPRWPANCPGPSVLSVAATSADERLAAFSNRGPTQVDLGAPGEAVLSTVPGGYASMSGTSMAAPQISGIAAAALGVRPLLSAEHLAAALLAGGDPLGGLAGLTRSGRRASLAGTMAVVLGGVPPDGAPPPTLGPPAPGSSPPASRRVRLRLTAPRPLRPRARGVLRLESTCAGRVRIAVRHPGRRGLVGAFTTPVGVGTARARIPAGLAMRMSRPGRYRVTATLAGARPATAALVVRDGRPRSRPG